MQNKSYPPGQHGKGRRKKLSEFAIQLAEKQKAKYTYGLLEKQFANVFNKASRKSGITGEILLQLLESRLDNTIYRLGIASTRRAARQLVLHKHIMVNGRIVNIPSYSLRNNDVVSVRERSKSLELISNSLASKAIKTFSWLEWNSTDYIGKFLNPPDREEIPENIKEQLIVELYSK